MVQDGGSWVAMKGNRHGPELAGDSFHLITDDKPELRCGAEMPKLSQRTQGLSTKSSMKHNVFLLATFAVYHRGGKEDAHFSIILIYLQALESCWRPVNTRCYPEVQTARMNVKPRLMNDNSSASMKYNSTAYHTLCLSPSYRLVRGVVATPTMINDGSATWGLKVSPKQLDEAHLYWCRRTNVFEHARAIRSSPCRGKKCLKRSGTRTLTLSLCFHCL
jgi:hypothetical protein